MILDNFIGSLGILPLINSPNTAAARLTPKSTASRDLPARKLNRTPRVAFILIEGQEKGVPCTMRDFTSEGACIMLGGWIGVPERFTLYTDPNGARFACQVISRRGGIVQVSFNA
jgi:hypothetical protein